MKKNNKDRGIFKGINLFCENLNKTIVVAEDKLLWDGGSSYCDMCGSNGFVSVEFFCECGKNHKITLKDW